MLLLLLVLLRTSLLDDWQAQLPEGAPNHFVLNIAPGGTRSRDARCLDDADVVWRASGSIRCCAAGSWPWPVSPLPAERHDGVGEPDGPRQREANFTWSAQLPDGNRAHRRALVEDGEKAVVSVEVGLPSASACALGDELDLLIGASPSVCAWPACANWTGQSFKPNFFMVFPPGLLERYPATWMTSFYLPPQRKAFLNTLLRAHPTVTVIEVDAIMEQLRQTLQQRLAAIELVLLLVLVTGLLVLVAGHSVESRSSACARGPCCAPSVRDSGVSPVRPGH
jgi:putative ABC transport system permease protein